MAPAVPPLRKKDALSKAAKASAAYFATLLSAKAKDADDAPVVVATEEAAEPPKGPISLPSNCAGLHIFLVRRCCSFFWKSHRHDLR